MSNNLARKIKRKQQKEAKKELTKKIKDIFLPDNCMLCQKPFDKKSREHAMTWMVSIIKEQKILTCPECWEGLKKMK